jgi:membrane-associated phospholipid phosphatase
MLDWPEMDRPVPIDSRRFNTLAASVYAAFLLFAIIGCWQADIDLPYAGTGLLLRCVGLALFLPLPVFWHFRHRPDRREAVLAPFWLLAFSFTLPSIVNICGRSEMPLQDLNLLRLDSMLGFNVPAIAAWADQHRLGHLINDTYPLLIDYLVPLALLAPALFGRWIAAREFLAANVIAMIIGLTAFALLPAVGPWYGYNLPPGPGQEFCQTQLLALREPGPIVAQAAGIICFPSFHVIWAIFCARALWTFRLIRIPACLFAGLIILSTLTTGWHYFVDVIAGFLIAYISIRIASRIIGNQPQTACATLPLRVATAAIPTQDPSIAQE